MNLPCNLPTPQQASCVEVNPKAQAATADHDKIGVHSVHELCELVEGRTEFRWVVDGFQERVVQIAVHKVEMLELGS
jgi:hypothetical protein